VHLVNTEPLTAVQHTFRIRLYTEKPAQFPFTHIAKHSGRDRHFQSQDFGASFLFGVTVERVCVSLLRGPHKSALRWGFVFNNCVQNARCTAVLCLSSPDTEQTLSFVVAL